MKRKQKRICVYMVCVALVIIFGFKVNANPGNNNIIEEMKKADEMQTIRQIEIVDAAAELEKEPEYIPSKKAEPGYISELELIEITEEIGNQYDICPELLQAMAERESSLKIDAINGDCKGLMQISERWHVDRMERLGVTDIDEPYYNILLAADFLVELYNEPGSPHATEYVLMRYNMKIETANRLWEAGEITDYASSIVARAEELERLHGK